MTYEDIKSSKSNINSPHIIVRLKGGLGNQMFMYAFAKSLSIKNRIPLKVDTISGFSNDKIYKRQYLLHHFSIDDEIASNWESFHHILGKRRRKVTSRYNKFLSLTKRNYITERVKAFDKDIFDMPITRSIYLDGYWGSYKYFEWIDEIIREKFSFNFPLTSELLEEARLIESCDSVCLGIRRFEDVPLKKRNQKTILGLGYYQKAIQIIEDMNPEPHFFIFTQDYKWAEQNISSKHCKITFIKEKDPHLGAVMDLWLMTLCKHYIISNSTLHWWGAWLNVNPDKIIIAPRSGWSKDDLLGNDYLPSKWITVDL